MIRQLTQKIDVSRHKPVLGNDCNRIAKLCEHFETTARDPQFLLDRLIRIGHAAHHQHLRLPAWRLEFRTQQLRRVGFHHDLVFEIEPGGKTEILMRRPRITINAAVLTTSIRIQTRLEANIGAVVARDD